MCAKEVQNACEVSKVQHLSIRFGRESESVA